MNNEELDNAIKETTKLLSLICNSDLDEIKREISCKKYYYNKCKELLNKYPDNIELGKYVTAYVFYGANKIGVYVSPNSSLTIELYSNYCSLSSEVYGFFEKVFNLLIEPICGCSITKKIRFEDFEFEGINWYYYDNSVKKEIDKRIEELEKTFEKIIELSKNEKFITLIDTMVGAYTNYLLTLTNKEN